jgi:hypothetical protein
VTTDFLRGIADLPGFRTFAGSAAAALHGVPDSGYRRWLHQAGGAIALEGALRFFPTLPQDGLHAISFWNSEAAWKPAYGSLAPTELLIFAEDAFGVQFGFRPNASIARFWNETGEIEALELGLADFVQAIADDPDDTVSYALYCEASRTLGRPDLSEHFSCRVETALGGRLAVDNLQRVNSLEHMRASGKIAQQIAKLPVGTKIGRVERE